MTRLQTVAEHTPTWVNWITIVGAAVLSWLQPIAALVAIAWGGLQIYGWFEKRRNKRRKP